MSSNLSLSPIELLFNDKTLREVIHDGVKYYPIIDVIYAMGYTSPDSYWPKFKKSKKKTGEIQLLPKWQELKVKSKDGKSYETECYNRQGVIQIVQSMRTKKAERFRQWFSSIIEERFQEEENPELAYQRGYDRAKNRLASFNSNPKWIAERMETITFRKQNNSYLFDLGLTGENIAEITDRSYRIGFGLNTKQYYFKKGLIQKKDNLRDHMTSYEIKFIGLYELAFKERVIKEELNSLESIKNQSDKVSLAVRNAREAFEKVLGESVVSSSNNLTEQTNERRLLADKKKK